MQLVLLGLLLAQMLAVPAPDGGTVQADAALAPAVRLLASLDEGRPLVQTLADGGVRLVMAVAVVDNGDTEPLAAYRPTRRMIVVSPRVRGMDPATVATLLAHEASHARDQLSGTMDRELEAYGATEACYVWEERATLTELYVWQATQRQDGSPAPANAYETFLTDALARYYADPDAFAATVRALYAGQCEGP